MTPLSERGLNRSTLQRQLLLRREGLEVAEAVRRIMAIQAQEPASPYLALWSRVAGLAAADVDAAFVDGRVVKATLMRMTLHAVHVDDYGDFHDAMQTVLRASRLGDSRYLVGGLTPDAGLALEDALVAFAHEPRSREEIEAHLADHVTDTKSIWWALRSLSPVVHAPTGGPWSFNERKFVVSPGHLRAEPRLEAVGRLVRRYLEGFGPATIADISQFTMLPRGRIREALASTDLVELPGPSRATLYDVADAPALPDEATPAPARLLPMWDSILFAYDDRARVIPPELRPFVIRTNGDTLPTVLVDGFVAGVWRPLAGGIEVTALSEIPARAWDELAEEAGALTRFLADREPNAYSRYRRWWERLPEPVERRILPG